MRNLVMCVALVSVTLTSVVRADNWAHWRGPTGNGSSLTANPPTEWNTRKNVKWKVAIPGRGSSSPIIWGNQVFITTAVPAAKNEGKLLEFKLLCYNRDDGKLLWEKTAATAAPHEGTHGTNGFASASPCTDGEHVYAHFGSRGLYCYTMQGDFVWKRDDFGNMRIRNSFGEGSSPTLSGEKIIVPWDHEGGSNIYALNKRSGKTDWKKDRDETTCWATPLVVDNHGKKQVIMNGQKFARSYDLESGDELWRCPGQTQRPIASPVADKGLVVVGSGHQGSFMAAFHLDGHGDIKDTKSVEWMISRDTPDVASPLLSAGRIYFHKAKTAPLTCVDIATGKPHYTAARVPGLQDIYASPIAAGGHVYLTGRNGTTVVIKDADKFDVVASNSVDETVDATPAPVDNQLFIRGENHLFCIAAK